MQTANFIDPANKLTAENINGRTFSTKFFDLEEMGWDFDEYYTGVYRARNNGGYPSGEEYADIAKEVENNTVVIRVDDDGSTSWWPLGGDATPTGDDKQTLLDLEVLRLAHQLEEM